MVEARLPGVDAHAQRRLRAEVILDVEGASEPRNGAGEGQRELVGVRCDRPSVVRRDMALDIPEPDGTLVELEGSLDTRRRKPAAHDRQGAMGPP